MGSFPNKNFAEQYAQQLKERAKQEKEDAASESKLKPSAA